MADEDGRTRYERLADSVLEEDPCERAALALLDAHGHWLEDPEFVRVCVWDSGGQAWVQWMAVKRFLRDAGGTALEREVLLLAFELAEHRTGRRLRESVAFDGLDQATRDRLAEVIDRAVW